MWSIPPKPSLALWVLCPKLTLMRTENLAFRSTEELSDRNHLHLKQLKECSWPCANQQQKTDFSPQSRKQSPNFIQDASERFNTWMHKTLKVWKISKLNQNKISSCQSALIKSNKSENFQANSEKVPVGLIKNKKKTMILNNCLHPNTKLQTYLAFQDKAIMD